MNLLYSEISDSNQQLFSGGKVRVTRNSNYISGITIRADGLQFPNNYVQPPADVQNDRYAIDLNPLINNQSTIPGPVPSYDSGLYPPYFTIPKDLPLN